MRRQLFAIYSGNFCRVNIIESPAFYFFNQDFRLVKRIDGKRGVWSNGKWKIENGVIQEKTIGDDFKSRPFKELSLEIPETPNTFIKGIKRPEDMSYRQLKQYLKKYGENKLIDEEKLVKEIVIYEDGQVAREESEQFFHNAYEEKLDYTSLVLKVVCSDGEVFEKEIYRER